mmetsp:Transcript_24436/g.48065  ORF Transcript_24436/g.48065 Transcript_24436/m.48065 type:complete len:931 (-) Transcript_24436:230-3022(-)|eukprot:CAMPEP_0175137418 /NCGR_PEP_ID=MMETSP0087-20121206/9802_1 /TAXON_ID=136419 /ORGANISM="Unknown Unknown, Strain D1" /LENGTH=930 /DNA_ID=CAMNT_0016420247 /DNA_START=48 /DNA_END=2840 /DNA_ORIENTATION=+
MTVPTMHCNTVDGGTANGPPNSGDTAFMVFAATMVFIMTPAMALSQAGMIRRKNAASMLMQIMTGLAIGSLLYFMFGFSLSFGPSQGGVIGNLRYAFLRNLDPHDCDPQFGLNADTIPGGVWFAYQMMFAIHTPLITTGAWVEKMNFNAFLVFVVLWPILVYYPLSHAVWNKDGFLAKMGVLDYAGGLVIHASSGVAGLMVSLTLQRRKENEGTPHHNLPIAYLGCLLVFAGWYSFIAGAGGKANGQAVDALICTHVAACSGALVWVFLGYYRERFWKVTGVISGVFAGLGSITAGAGYISPWTALIIGTVGSFASYYSVILFKEKWKLDDVLDCTSLQGVTGLIGAVAIGFFSNEEISYTGGVDGLLYGGGAKLLGLQLLGCLYACVWSAVFTYAILWVMKATVGVDIDADVEEVGLDVSQIGEQAYDEQLDLELDLGKEGVLAKLHEAVVVGDLRKVQSMLMCKADPSCPDYIGRTCVQLAASNGHLEVLKYFRAHFHHLQYDSTDDFNGTPMLDAFSHGHYDVCSWLVSKASVTGDGVDFIVAQLFAAAFEGDVALLQAVQTTGISMDTHDYDRRTPLMVAAAEGHYSAVKFLVEHDADILFTDRWGFDSAKTAQMSEHFAIANYLKGCATQKSTHTLKSDMEIATATTPLLSSSRNSDTEIDVVAAAASPLPIGTYGSVQDSGGLTLASQGAEEEDKEEGEEEEKEGEDKSKDGEAAAKLAVSTTATFTASSREMCKAAALGQLSEVKRLIKKGGKQVAVDGDYDQRSPLLMAASKGHADIVEYLLSLSVPVNSMDRFGNTPLKKAVDGQYRDLARSLRKAGGIIIFKDVGYLLCKLAFEGDLEGLSKLIDEGNDPNKADHDARTALHLAACEGHIKVARFLVANGSLIMAKDRFGRTPLDDSRHYCRIEVTAFLEQMVKGQRKKK